MRSSLLRVPALLAAGCLSLLLTLPASAKETVKFPKAKPSFVLDVPEGWEAEETNDDVRVLTLKSKDGSAKFDVRVLFLEGVGTTGLKKVVQQLAKATVASAKMTDVKYTDPVEDKSGTGMPITGEVAMGKIDGEDISFVFALFAVNGRCYELALTTETAAMDKGTKVADEILDSVLPLK